MKKKQRLALLVVPTILSLALATPAHAMGDDGDGDTVAVEQIGDMTPAALKPVIDYAFAQLGKPYVFGAAGPSAFDCSGLVMMAYRQIGMDLPHLSFTQATMGREVSKDDIRPGDLLFFYGGQAPARNKGHVAIAISGTHMISAPRKGTPVHLVKIPGNVQSVRRFVA